MSDQKRGKSWLHFYLDIEEVTPTENWTVAWKNDWNPVRNSHNSANSHADRKGPNPPADIPAYKDSVYSWLILGVAFLASFMTDGFSYAIGIYFVEFRDIFGSSAGITSLVSSLSFSVTCFAGNIFWPLVQLNKISCQERSSQNISGWTILSMIAIKSFLLGSIPLLGWIEKFQDWRSVNTTRNFLLEALCPPIPPHGKTRVLHVISPNFE